MSRHVIANILVFVLTGQLFGASAEQQTRQQQETALRNQAKKLPPNAEVEIRLQDGEKLRGRVAATSDESMVLATSGGQERSLPFRDIRSIRKISPHSGRNTAIIIAAVAGAGLIIFLLTAYKRIQNE
jgi:hypothetical protein